MVLGVLERSKILFWLVFIFIYFDILPLIQFIFSLFACFCLAALAIY